MTNGYTDRELLHRFQKIHPPPSAQTVREVFCPECGALPAELCRSRRRNHRETNHRDREIAWMRKHLEDEEASG